ncbi:MAG: hypothetical protein QOH12_3478 [Solirubrobacteraceae bacterium]|jgi:hypothetical protein|nr:hypothetical protein [Solirubrobacteraceae bacterium]
MSRCARAVPVTLAALLVGAAGAASGGGTSLALADVAPSGAAGSSSAADGLNQNQTDGTIMVGGGGQQAGQLQTTAETNAQLVGPDDGTIIIGGTSQANDQQSSTHQKIDQTESGTFLVIGDSLHQTAEQVAQTVLANGQYIDGSLVIGDVAQTNSQHANINQSINQSLTGTFVILGGSQPSVASGLAESFNGIARCAICADAVSDSGAGLVGGNLNASSSPSQSSNGIYIVTGDLDQRFDQTDTTILSNGQSVNGSVIIGNVSQTNAQNANVNQSINQSLSGTYLVFGSLDQEASQLALINESNHQQTQGG